jgi:hypothetical protein
MIPPIRSPAGRNDPCPCGSTKKYKRCCLRKDEAIEAARARGREKPIPPTVLAELRRHEATERARRAQFGEVRPVISTDWQDHKFVAVGSELHWSKRWRTFPDFLLCYIVKVLGADWGRSELAKDADTQHPIIRWYLAWKSFTAAHPAGPEGLAEGVPDGQALAYLLLAYELYILRDHGALQRRLIKRLKRHADFQGARYEVFVAATMIRAGFDLAHENETDATRKHPEFVATCRRTGVRLAVEAKSRHLPGVLGQAGAPPSAEAFRLDIRGLLQRALEKNPPESYVIFIDANMPPEYAEARLETWVADVQRAVELKDRWYDGVGLRGPSGFNLLLVTNVAHHYGAAGAPPPRPLFYRMLPSMTVRPLVDSAILLRIEESLEKAMNIPKGFD